MTRKVGHDTGQLLPSGTGGQCVILSTMSSFLGLGQQAQNGVGMMQHQAVFMWRMLRVLRPCMGFLGRLRAWAEVISHTSCDLRDLEMLCTFGAE